MLAFVAMTVITVSWTSGDMITLESVMENDDYWTELLYVPIKVDVTKVSTAAREVLQRLKAITPELAEKPIAEPEKKPAAESSAQPVEGSTAQPEKSEANPTEKSEETKVDHVFQVVSANALHVVADVVSLHTGESDALEFGIAVMASAVRCSVLQYVAVQVHAIERSLDSQPAAVNATRLTAVWDTLVLFLNTLTRLKESVAIESELHQRWVMVVEQMIARTLKADNLTSFQKLMDANHKSTCSNVVSPEQVPEQFGFNKETENWSTVDGINAIFNKSQKALDNIFKHFSVNTDNLSLWRVYLNQMELYEKITAIAAEKPDKEPAAVKE